MTGRIPDSFVSDLLTRVDIVDIVGSRLELKRAGREYRGLSPFTNEKTASFYVNPAKQMFFDFSSGKNGTAISFLMENDRLTFVEAVEELARQAGVDVPREGGVAQDRLVLEGPLDALAAAERFYRGHLRSSQPAIDYLKKRGLTGETAKLFGIGYAPESRDALTKLFPEADGQRQYAVNAGLVGRGEGGGYYDRFRNRVMFPIRDARGRTIGFGGRTLANDPAKYLNSPETPLFHKGRNLFGLYEAKQSTKSELAFLLVVEGYMDVVMLAHHGIRNVVATLGTATTREHLALLFKSTSRVVFCFDGDRAGRSAASRALEQALPEIYEGRECRFMFLPDGHDPDTLVQEVGAEEFRKLADRAMPLSDFMLADLEKKVDVDTRDGRTKLAELAGPLLDRLRDGALRRSILTRLAQRAGLNIDDVQNLPRQAGVRLVRAPVTSDVGRDDFIRSLEATPVRRALQMLLEIPSLSGQVKNVERLALLRKPRMELLIEAIDFFRDEPESTAAQLAVKWRGTDKEISLRSIDRIEAPILDSGVEAEFLDCISHLSRRERRQRLSDMTKDWETKERTPAEVAELRSIPIEVGRNGLQTRVDELRARQATRPLTENETLELEDITRQLGGVG